jgi:ribosomal-protein-serine acetyltransferase
VSLISVDWMHLHGELGYWLLERARGHGLATASVLTFVEYLFGTLGLERLELHIDPENGPARAVAVRCGFELEGLRRGYPVLARGARTSSYGHGWC